MMTRTQLSFEAEELRRARTKAHQLGISLAEYVRRLVAADLGARGREQGPSAVFDLGSSAGSDVAVDKGRMLGEAFAARPR
jgi:hypothetical protein